MPFSIALAGKGGTGKTTVAGLLVKYLVQKNKIPILAVDADSNANLNEVLGLKVSLTIGAAREEMKRGNVPNGMTKDVFMSMKLEESIIEAGNYDLIVMGQPEGTGCYCAANTLLTNFLDKLKNNYSYMVIDNEAGMEHISRLTTSNVDVLLVVADTSLRGLQAAFRIKNLAKNLNIGVQKVFLIINRIKVETHGRASLQENILSMIKEENIELAGIIPDDENVYKYDLKGTPTLNLPEELPVVKSAFKIFDKFII
ncbi:MAG: AAA family ATPase [Desulfobacterales bacterium]|nr:AAA family ATPase [Desulfobacterales bacterium]MBF0397180.1 AAA family ATPase [Desulfobacterales bacterium]